MKKTDQAIVNIKRGVLLCFVALAALLLLMTSACSSSSTEAETVKLEITQNLGSQVSDLGAYDVEGNFVLRCETCTIANNEITAKTSKAGDMAVTTLIFVQQATEDKTDVPIAVVQVTGEENEYDMAQAEYYTVSYASLADVMDRYGMPFWSWVSGSCEESGKFPCCE